MKAHLAYLAQLVLRGCAFKAAQLAITKHNSMQFVFLENGKNRPMCLAFKKVWKDEIPSISLHHTTLNSLRRLAEALS